jgi:predicted amidohydrolase YtcJ
LYQLGEQLLIKDQSPLLPNCDLKQCTSVSQIVNLLTETVKQRQRPENSTNMPVLVGTGWHESNLGGETLVRSHMETINFPIVLFRNCYHLCVLNTSALTLFGLLKTASGSSVAHNCQHKLLQELSDYLKNAGGKHK